MPADWTCAGAGKTLYELAVVYHFVVLAFYSCSYYCRNCLTKATRNCFKFRGIIQDRKMLGVPAIMSSFGGQKGLKT